MIREMKNNFKEKVKVCRTTEGTVFEMVFLVLALVVWALIILMITHAPNVVATHFDLSGRPNGYGSPWGLLFPCILVTVVGGCLLLGAYFPHTLNMPVEVKTPRQYELLIRMTRISALVLLLMALAIPATVLLFSHPSPWPVIGCVGLLLGVIISFCVMIHRAGR